MQKFNKLSKAEMKKIGGGDCDGKVKCEDGVYYGGYFDCSDYVYGGDGEAVCQYNGHGSSISCDCSGGSGLNPF